MESESHPYAAHFPMLADDEPQALAGGSVPERDWPVNDVGIRHAIRGLVAVASVSVRPRTVFAISPLCRNRRPQEE